MFEGARLITGEGTAPIENSIFIVENDQFTAVGRQGELQVPAGAVRVDLTGKTVMPAKIDMHGHLGFENMVEGTMSKENFTRENLIDHLERYAYLGYSAVVSIADLAEREIMLGDHLNLSRRHGTLACRRRGASRGATCRSGAARGHSQCRAVPHGRPGNVLAGRRGGRHPSRNDVMYPVTTAEEAREAVQDYVKTKSHSSRSGWTTEKES